MHDGTAQNALAQLIDQPAARLGGYTAESRRTKSAVSQRDQLGSRVKEQPCTACQVAYPHAQTLRNCGMRRKAITFARNAGVGRYPAASC